MALVGLDVGRHECVALFQIAPQGDKVSTGGIQPEHS